MEDIEKTNEEAKNELDTAFAACDSDAEKRAEVAFNEATNNPEHIPATTEETTTIYNLVEITPSAKVGLVAVVALACDGAYHCAKTTATLCKKAAKKVTKFIKGRKTVVVVEETTDEPEEE